MILSDLRKGMTVYIAGHDTYYECIVVGWTDKHAILEYDSEQKEFIKLISDLIERLPENVTPTQKTGVYKETSTHSTPKKEQRPKWPTET
jgi:hypothetical protein